MNLSEKIIMLRNQKGYSQEEFAELLDVSRQSVSKWETGIATPEIDKLVQIGKIFAVTVDSLLRDELSVSGAKDMPSCGNISNCEEKSYLFQGVLIKESISDENILDLIDINKVEIWKTGDNPKYWTAIFFTSNYADFPKAVSKALIGNWFVDFKYGNIKYVVFKEKILKYEIGNQSEKAGVLLECRNMGIPESQMNWSE